MKELISELQNAKQCLYFGKDIIYGEISTREFKKFLKSRRIEKMTLDYGDGDEIYLSKQLEQWFFENHSVSFIRMSNTELYDFIEHDVPKQIICYSKYCKELPNERDRTFTISRSKPDEVWNVSMTPLAYKVQGYPALSDK